MNIQQFILPFEYWLKSDLFEGLLLSFGCFAIFYCIIILIREVLSR